MVSHTGMHTMHTVQHTPPAMQRTPHSYPPRPQCAQAVDKWSFTPLHYAASYGRIAIAKLLLNAGARVGASNVDGTLPLDLARAEHPNLTELHEATPPHPPPPSFCVEGRLRRRRLVRSPVE